MNLRRFLTVVALFLLAGMMAGQPKAPPHPGRTAPTAPGPSFQIAGDVFDTAGAGIFGAIVTTAGNLSARTDRQGHFLLKGCRRSGTYVVRVAKPEYTFQPDRQMVPSPPEGDVANVRFTGTKNSARK